MSNQEIRGISGLELGQEFYTEDPQLSETDCGEVVYAVDMDDLPFGMTSCHVCVTPLSSRVSMIFLHRDVFECDVVDSLFKEVRAHMSTYGRVETIAKECEMLVDLRCAMGHREVVMKSEQLMGRRARITLYYFDHDVRDEAKEEGENLAETA